MEGKARLHDCVVMRQIVPERLGDEHIQRCGLVQHLESGTHMDESEIVFSREQLSNIFIGILVAFTTFKKSCSIALLGRSIGTPMPFVEWVTLGCCPSLSMHVEISYLHTE